VQVRRYLLHQELRPNYQLGRRRRPVSPVPVSGKDDPTHGEQPSITKEELEKIQLEEEEFERNHKKEVEQKELEKKEYDKNLKNAIKVLEETIINRNSSKDIVNQLKVNYRSETYQKFLKETFKNYDEKVLQLLSKNMERVYTVTLF
jgi:hypothetical protein